MIVGIDEVGRGAWAGPLVVGAVLLAGAPIEGLTDSKKLTKLQRERLDREIRQKAAGIGLGWVSAKQIDHIGLSEALKLASRRAVAHIYAEYDQIVIDGTVKFIDDSRVTVMKKADLLVPSVSAASIVAKVARDNYMSHLDAIFPGYKFKSHVGYGTAAHRQAIRELGVTPLHRLSYAPLVEYDKPKTVIATTRQIGDAAEEEVASFLIKSGHRVLARNWKTPRCEIDVVSIKKSTIYFIEVKHRKNAQYGDGLAAITPIKQRQMAFAAEVYAAKNNLAGTDLRLAVASTTGTPPVVTDFLELC